MQINDNLLFATHAANIHTKIGNDLRNFIKPGTTFNDIITFVEKHTREEVSKTSKLLDLTTQKNGGIAFPISLAMNNCIAHYSPNSFDNNVIISSDDIIKIDYGVHINGNIIDSAFTLHFNDKFDEFINLSKELTRLVIKNSGVDVILGDIGFIVDEFLYSSEIEIDNKKYQLKSITDLSGHNLLPFIIHAGKAVPNTKINNYNLRMNENEFYAIEPFLTTGNGTSISKFPAGLYNINNKSLNKKIKDKQLKKFFDNIYINYNTLPFCERWLVNNFTSFNNSLLDKLINDNFITAYPPLFDINNSYVSHFEHTIFIKDNGVVILTDNNFY